MTTLSPPQLEDHGLTYPPGFLSSLPLLSPPMPPTSSSSSSQPGSPVSPILPGLPQIRSLTAAQFQDMHTRYLTTHAPDSVIFPFLHGLEGDNDAQNAFFCAGSNTNGSPPDRERIKARVPKFRGLMWVASDEDEVEEYERALRARKAAAAARAQSNVLPVPITSHSPSHTRGEDELDIEIDDDLEDDDYSTSSLDDDEDVDDGDSDFSHVQMPMEVDGPIDLDGPSSSHDGVGVVGMDVEMDGVGQGMGGLLDHAEGAHMHPHVQRGGMRPELSAIDTGAKEGTRHRLSNASSTSSFTSTTSASEPPSASTSASTSLPTPPTPPSSLPDSAASLPPAVECASSTENSNTQTPEAPERVVLTSTFKPRELLCIDRETGETRFVEPRVPEGISLRNFGIQVPIFATLSDIVVYSPRGNTNAALAVASHFAHAIEAKRRQRAARGQSDLLHYNVFVLVATPEDMVRDMPHIVTRMSDEVVGSGAHTAGTDALTVSETHPSAHMADPLTKHQRCLMRKANTISFAQREKEEMKELTQASEILTVPIRDEEERRAFSGTTTAGRWDQSKGQVFLGNASDVPTPTGPSPPRGFGSSPQAHAEEWEYKSNDPALGLGYDVCIECDDMAPFPSQAHMRAAEEHLAKLERRWAEKCEREMVAEAEGGRVEDPREVPVRPPPNASLVVHLPFPSSVAYAGNSILPFIAWLEGLVAPVEAAVTVGAVRERREKEREAEEQRRVGVSGASRPQMRRSTHAATIGHATGGYNHHHGFGGPSSLPPPSSFPPSFFPPGGSQPAVPTASAYMRMRSTSATHLSTPPAPSVALQPLRTRPLKILIYSADGYTESSSLALALLMSLRGMSLPEAYLELQVEKRRSFFVYTTEMTPLKRVEARLERERTGSSGSSGSGGPGLGFRVHARVDRQGSLNVSFSPGDGSTTVQAGFFGPGMSSSMPSESASSGHWALQRRPRASTLPPPSTTFGDHQVWFNDPRFDGSFPSRVLPFLYLGNLNHAANAYMLHALGITHVVSVGECALIPPDTHAGGYAPTAKPGSLWIEEREGRIKVLDIKGVCDDGIDSLEPQLPPICEWIDEARESGGKVLVHCRVGVSRSATVTIAYVMKHLGIPLVDAYLIVRSRRLSVLIQPNMRLLYNLLGWEVKLAQERAGDDKDRLAEELARCLNWPYLAKEVHALNEKYLH